MKVLLVDDDPVLLELSKNFLELFHKITSDTVNSASEALTKLEKDSYDVIVSDYDMPFIDGITFLKTIRNKKISIPFILFTGFIKEEIIQCAIENGANSFIQKTSNPKIHYSELAKQIWEIVSGTG